LGPTGKSAVCDVRHKQCARGATYRNLGDRRATGSNVGSTDSSSAKSDAGSADANHADFAFDTHHEPTAIGRTVSCTISEPLY
jgi:hypothetical protein